MTLTFNAIFTHDNSWVISTMLPCFKYKRKSPNEVETFMRRPSYYVLHMHAISWDIQLNSFFAQMSGVLLCNNFNAFPKVVQKASLVVVLDFVPILSSVGCQEEVHRLDNRRDTS